MRRFTFIAILQLTIACIAACRREPVVTSSPRLPAKALAPKQTIMRVGGEVTAPVVAQRVEIDFAKCTKQRVPIPFMILEAVVDARGQIRDARFLKPVPRCADEAVIHALNQWKFKPGTYRGRPVSVIYNMSINVHYR